MGKRAKPRRDGWRGRAIPLITAIVVIAFGAFAVSPAPAQPSLPDGRGYELVTPVDKNGGDAFAALTSSTDGNRFAYYSYVAYAGAEANNGAVSYLAQRGDDGWTTRPMSPKVGTPGIGTNAAYSAADFTEDLSESITISRVGAAESNVANVFSTRLDGSVTWLTAPTVTGAPVGDKGYAGRSADGSHVVFESTQQFDPAVTVPGRQVWESVNGAVRLVSILPNGTLDPNGAGVGSGVNGALGRRSGFNGTLVQPDAVSEDGSKIFFGLGGDGTTVGVFVRIDGTETRELALSQRTGSIGQEAFGASFAGASADGDVAVFTSPDLLTDDATPNGGIYAFDLRSGRLRFLSPGATDPNGAQVEAVSLVSRDGRRVFFVAQSVLVPGKGVAGGHNLYVSDEGRVSFIATLGNDDGQNWNRGTGSTGGSLTTKATADGRFFVFQSWEPITSVDNAGHQEIYLYDADLGTVTCVSCGRPGHTPAGDASIVANPLPRGGSLVQFQIGRPRTITDDGSRVYFQTTDSLVPQDVNNRADVYEYRTATGSAAMLSAGTGGYDSEIAGNSPDGRDVYFFTRDSLVRRDTDGGAKDIYDARVGGGFPDPPDASPCADDACQPVAKGPASPLASGTADSAGDTVKERRAPALYVQRVTATGRKNAIRTGRLTLVVNAEAAGVVRATGTASYGKHKVYRLKPVSARIGAAATKHLHISLPSAVRRQLERHHRVKLAITVTHDKATGPVRVALTLS